MGLWCNGSTALRQSGRCGFDSRQVHAQAAYLQGRSIMGEPVDGAWLSFRKRLIVDHFSRIIKVTLTEC